jgi:transcriptional antiterminator RfaH
MCFPEDVLTSGMTEGTSWFAAHTKPKQEKALAWQLRQRGIGYYLPLVKKKQADTARVRFSFVPLFTGYVFIKGNSGHRIEALKTNRIVRMIHAADQKLLIKELNTVHAAITYRKAEIYSSPFKKGKRVRVTEGPLKGAEGTVLQRKNRRELIVQIESVHQVLRIDIESDKIEAV